MRSLLADLALAPVAFVLGLAIAAVAAGRLGRALGTGPVPTFLVAASLALVVSLTLTPGRVPSPRQAFLTCDLSRIGPASAATYLSVNDTSLNVALFVPLGASLAALPRSRRTTVLVVLSGCLPLAIEAIQAALPGLNRTCQAADLFDNAAGLVIGLCVGAGATALVHTIRS